LGSGRTKVLPIFWIARGIPREGATRGYKGLQGATSGYKWLQVATRGYKGLQGVTRAYNGLQGPTRAYKGLQRATRAYKGASRAYKGLQGPTRAYKGRQGPTKAYKGLQGPTRGYKGLGTRWGNLGGPMAARRGLFMSLKLPYLEQEDQQQSRSKTLRAITTKFLSRNGIILSGTPSQRNTRQKRVIPGSF
jgi:hypothetical protein